MAKKLNKEEQKQFDELLQEIGKTLIATMSVLDAPNFITCNYVDTEDPKVKYRLEFRRVRE